MSFASPEDAPLPPRHDELSAILATALDCIIIMDAEGRIREFNPAAERTFRYRRSEVIGALLADKIIPPAMREAHHAGLSRYLQSGVGPLLGQRVEVKAQRSDGSEFPCELTITAIRSGQATLFAAYLRDLTERFQTELEIRELNASLERQVIERTSELARFAKVADTTMDFVGIADMESRIVYINPAGRRLCGIPPAHPEENIQVSDVHPAWAYERISREIGSLDESDAWTGEVALLHREGHEIPVSIMGMIIRGPDGQPQYGAAIMRDLSERVRIEKELERNLERERQLGRMKSSFVSTISHEFRTPLGIILSSSEILDRYFDSLEVAERREQLGAIGDAVRRMTGLMEQVLMFSRIEGGHLAFRPQELALSDFCVQLRDELVSATGHRCPIELEMPPDLPLAQADANLLRHILTNLLTNAVKYSRSGELVRLAVQRLGREAVFVVQDRGLGIPSMELERLFTAFYRAHNVADLPGTGLGLVIVRRCLDAHGGEIQIESVEDQGTTVRVTVALFSEQIP